jgi:hypothetical protein
MKRAPSRQAEAPDNGLNSGLAKEADLLGVVGFGVAVAGGHADSNRRHRLGRNRAGRDQGAACKERGD